MNNTMESTVERTPKYNVGDKVVYYCLYGKEEKLELLNQLKKWMNMSGIKIKKIDSYIL